jgi:hypothetical protein
VFRAYSPQKDMGLVVERDDQDKGRGLWVTSVNHQQSAEVFLTNRQIARLLAALIEDAARG